MIEDFNMAHLEKDCPGTPGDDCRAYSHLFVCGNCGSKFHVHIKLGESVNQAVTDCPKCKCEVKGKRHDEQV